MTADQYARDRWKFAVLSVATDLYIEGSASDDFAMVANEPPTLEERAEVSRKLLEVFNSKG